MLSDVTKRTLEYIQKKGRSNGAHPIRTLNAMSCYPLAYRTFGGQARTGISLDDETMEKAFGCNYLLTLIASGVTIRELLYQEPESCHSLYCDGMTYRYFDRHGIAEHGPWDRVDHQTLDSNVTMDNVDHRIYYSIPKPYALKEERKFALRDGLPVFFVDADLILKARHDLILKNAEKIRAAFGHLEALREPCYSDFTRLHFPEGYHLSQPLDLSLPAVNTCLMYFNDMDLLEDWCNEFAALMMNNWLPEAPDEDTISRQLLGFDQRTFPFVADRRGWWGTEDIAAFLDIIWDPPFFYHNQTGKKAHWHYYTLEYHPEKVDWMQDITHTWINKHNIERDALYQNYQGCLMLEMILELQPDMEPHLRTFKA